MTGKRTVAIEYGHEYMPKNEMMVFDNQMNEDEEYQFSRDKSRSRCKSVLEDENNFFYDVYKHAKNNVERIINSQQQFIEIQRMQDVMGKASCMNDAKTMQRVNNALLCAPNNVIAFCGDRGEGKTSAMISFSTALKSYCEAKRDKDPSVISDFWGGTISNRKFEVLSCIDPTSMEKDDGFLKIVLSYMFNQFKAVWENEQKDARCYAREDNLQKGQTLLELFQKCYQDIEPVRQELGFSGYDGLEEILDTGKCKLLRGTVYQVVQKYLEYMDKDVLLIQIDDADLNISRTYEIVETIRKYLFLPNVIVMLAVNMRQLESTVEQDFLKEYSVSIQFGGAVDVERCYHIAERYVDKVIPGSRRIDLPKLDGRQQMRIEYLKKIDNKLKNILEIPNGKDWGFQEQLLRFMQQKTGITFLAQQNQLHPILPRSMRELTHFLNFFDNLWNISECKTCDGSTDVLNEENLEASNDAKKKILYNLEQLKYYLIEIWGAYHLTNTTRSFLREFDREEDDLKHKNVISFLEEYYCHACMKKDRNHGLRLDSCKDQFRRICCEAGVTGVRDENEDKLLEIEPMYANVMEILYLLEEELGTTAARDTAYAVRMAYTITLQKMKLEYDGVNPELELEIKIRNFIQSEIINPRRLFTPNKKDFYGNFPILGSLLKSWIKIDTASIYNGVRELCTLNAGPEGEIEFLPEISGNLMGNTVPDGIMMVNVCNPLFVRQKKASGILLNWDVQNVLTKRLVNNTGINDSFWRYITEFYGNLQEKCWAADYMEEFLHWFTLDETKAEPIPNENFIEVNGKKLYATGEEPHVCQLPNLAWAIQLSNPEFLKTEIMHWEHKFRRYKEEKKNSQNKMEASHISSLVHMLAEIDHEMMRFQKTGWKLKENKAVSKTGKQTLETKITVKFTELRKQADALCSAFSTALWEYNADVKAEVEKTTGSFFKMLDILFVLVPQYCIEEDERCYEMLKALKEEQ